MLSYDGDGLCPWAVGFNPHPPLRADAMPAGAGDLEPVPVSILTRPYGRMLYVGYATWSRQSTCFNPHPPLRADAIGSRLSRIKAYIVSILTRPYGRMLYGDTMVWYSPEEFQSSPALTGGCYLFRLGPLQKVIPVSILTRPYGRMLSQISVSLPEEELFQSSPALTGGCYILVGQ